MNCKWWWKIGMIGMIACGSVFALVAGEGCHRKQGTPDKAVGRDINQVMADHTGELMGIPGVTGVAIGKTDDSTDCILVLVEKETPDLDQKLPRQLEGHPVRLMVSGRIVPMGGK